MSRAKAQDNSTDVSLFPFLAVLICTMGSLLVVLVGVTKLSHKEAAEKAAQQPADVGVGIDAAKTDRELAEVKKYAEYLKQVRADAKAKLGDDQQRLSHIEDHIRRLGEQLRSLKHAEVELAALEDVHSHDREKAEKEVSRLQELIAETKENIELLKADESLKRRSYAVVPYVGKSGTQRRPIYIECRKNKVILQPEGVELTPEDFLPPLGPGNPLASALRAAREHISREDPTTAGDAAAYPLILVRPDGIAAYYRVRDAIESWDADFGYELIDGDWDLEFPPANPQLADVENRAVKLARARERMLAEAAPRAYGLARSARGAGFDAGLPNGSQGDDSMGGGYGSSDGHGTYGGGNGDGTGDRDYGGGQPGDQLMAGDEDTSEKSGDGMILGQSGGDGFNGEGGPAGGEGGSGGESSGDTDGPVLGGPEGDRYAQEGEAGSPARAAGERELYAGVPSGGSPNGTGGQSPTPGGGNSSPASGSSMSSGSPGGPSGTAAGSVGSVGTMSTPGSSSASMSQTTPNHDSQTKPGNSSSQGDPEGQPNPLSFERSFDHDSQQPAAVANIRGKDWAVSNSEGVPIRRSVQVVVRQDHLAILPERTRSGEIVVDGKEIPLKGSTVASLDAFVKALQDHMVDWGMAGQGLYWRPVLVLNVGPDGQKRADDLAQLLRNSGMELRRSSDTAMHEEGGDSNATR